MNHDTTPTSDKGNFVYALIGFMVSIIKAFFEHIDGWAILQSIVCALCAYLSVRLFKKLFPEKPPINQ